MNFLRRSGSAKGKEGDASRLIEEPLKEKRGVFKRLSQVMLGGKKRAEKPFEGQLTISFSSSGSFGDLVEWGK